MFRADRLAPDGLDPARFLPGSSHAIAFPIDYALVRSLEGFEAQRQSGMATARPGWHSDILWHGPSRAHAYRHFEKLFDDLKIPQRAAPHLDLYRQVRMYGGFIVTRSRCRQPDFHTDFKEAGGQGMSLITPIGTVPPDFGLLYYDDAQKLRIYEYVEGEAILFGEQFVHSTRPGETDGAVSLLSFTFGTDKMDYWPAIRASVGYQSKIVARPDGKLVRLLWRSRLRRMLARLARRLGLRRSS